MPDPLPVPDPPPPPEPPPVSPPPAPPPPLPLICWPTVSPTVATMPSIGAVSVAPLAASSALSTWDWSALTDAWSAASCALEALPVSSWESRAWSPASVASAWATWATSAGELMTARAWPAVTCCPTVAYTSVTWPAALKLSVLVDAGSMAPVVDSVWLMVVLTTGTRLEDGPAEAVDQVSIQAPTAAPATRIAIGTANRGLRTRRRARAAGFLRFTPPRVGRPGRPSRPARECHTRV